jgi:hypothetical protein
MTCTNLAPGRGAAKKLGNAIAALALMICASACGSSARDLDSAKIAAAIARAIHSEHKLDVKVMCPAAVPQQRGRVFTCSALLDVGVYPVAVTETDGSGHVRYEDRRPLAVLDVARVQRSIEASILSQRHVIAHASCPSQVLQRAGLVFRCTAVIDGGVPRYPFIVSELDATGNVRYVGT